MGELSDTPLPDAIGPSGTVTRKMSMTTPPQASCNDHPSSLVQQLNNFDDLLSSLKERNKLTQATHTELILAFSQVKSVCIDTLLSHVSTRSALDATSIPSRETPKRIQPVQASISKPTYAEAVNRASASIVTEPDQDIRTVVRKEMKKATLSNLANSNAERICASELDDQESRCKNIMVFGIPATTDSNESINNLLTACSRPTPSTPLVINRVGKINTKGTQALKVIFPCASEVDALFANLSALKDNPTYKSISIRHDLTPMQSEIRNELTETARKQSTDTQVFRVIGKPNDWRIIPARSEPR